MTTDEALALLRKLRDKSCRNLALIPNWSMAIGQCWDVIDITDGNPYAVDDGKVVSREPTIPEAVEAARVRLIELKLIQE